MTTVYVLTAELVDTNETGDYDGITAVHATRQGALEHFDSWIKGILTSAADVAIVYDHMVTLDTFVGGDPDPDDLDGTEIHWGVNTMTVGA